MTSEEAEEALQTATKLLGVLVDYALTQTEHITILGERITELEHRLDQLDNR